MLYMHVEIAITSHARQQTVMKNETKMKCILSCVKLLRVAYKSSEAHFIHSTLFNDCRYGRFGVK